jgi:hypothetical protein
MNQRGRLQRVRGALSGHVTTRHAAQFLVDDGNQLLQRLLIAQAPRLQ